MEHLSAVGGVALVWFLVVMIPGPNFVVVTRASAAGSRRAGFFIALGVSTGAATWASASLLGLSALFACAGWMYDAIRIVGGSYLVFMGLRTLWHAVKPPQLTVDEVPFSGSGLEAFRTGLLTSYSNPKTAAFFGSLFLSALPARPPFALCAAVVGAVVGISILWYCLVAFVFSTSLVQDGYRKAKRLLDALTGSLLSVLGLRLVFVRD